MDPSDGKSTDVDGSHSMNPSKMRELYKTWTLADDVALLKNLERFSELIINNASKTLCCMENLEDSLSNTCLKVKTVANNFQALADTQFIENRVDEDDDDMVDREESMERSQSSRNPPVNLEQAVANCADVIENKFEAMHLPGIDSEDEKSNNPVALIPKNVYQNRRLPHLIGSEEFMNDESVGLLENVTNKEDEMEQEEYENTIVSQALDDDFESYFDRKSEAVSFSSKQNEQIESSASSVDEKPSVSGSLENVKPDILSRHLSFEPLVLPTKPPLVPPDFVDSQSSESEDASRREDASISEESPTPSLTKGLYKSKTFSSFKTDLAKAIQARSMMPPSRSLAPKRKMSNDLDAGLPVDSPITHKDETDRVEMDRDEPAPPFRSTIVPSTSSSKDDIFHIPQTEILPCYGKRRARIQARRRPPTRKPRGNSYDVDNSPDEKSTSSSAPPATSSLLSPATDEEDLFLLPSNGIPSDLSNNDLFTSASLLSPGSAIEDKPIVKIEESDKAKIDKWDPFECDESDNDLFSIHDTPKPSTSVPEPSKKKSEPKKEPDLFGSSDEDDFLKDELFINKRFKSLNLNADQKNVFGSDEGESPFASSSGMKLSDSKASFSDEDELFSTKPAKTDIKVKTMNKTPVVKDPLLFGNDFNDAE